ncbi:MAG: hypothetical protein K2L38_05965 [Dysosmobacter sp.]|nr:hypothetical protein [Dysosmobacter sp.]
MRLWDRMRNLRQAVRDYPDACARLETAQRELGQTQKALEKSELECQRLSGDLWDTKHRLEFSEKKAEAVQTALETFCPKLDTHAAIMRFYEAVSPSLDPKGFMLYHMAKRMTGIDVPSFFAYEDNRGMFEVMEGHQLLDWLTAVHFQAVEWEVIAGSCYEKALLLEVDTSTPEYHAFESKLYRKVLDRMGFGDFLAPEAQVKSQEKEVIATEEKELKLYSRLSGELTEQEYDDPQLLDGRELAVFQDTILQGIEDERMPEEEERGLMAYFDGSDTVNNKVMSLFPSAEAIDGELYGVAVCRIREPLTPDELVELKDYCRSQYADGWGEGFAQRPRRTEHGELHVSFWRLNSTDILTKEEMETARAPSRPPHQQNRGGDTR